jgi:hypothetical protein
MTMRTSPEPLAMLGCRRARGVGVYECHDHRWTPAGVSSVPVDRVVGGHTEDPWDGGPDTPRPSRVAGIGRSSTAEPWKQYLYSDRLPLGGSR